MNSGYPLFSFSVFFFFFPAKTRMTSSSSSLSLEVSPRDCLIDENINIQVRGAEGVFRLEAAIVDEKGYFWVSWADFESKNGVIDLSTQAPLRGSYSGIHPMGLFYSLFPAPGERFPNRLMPRNVAIPQETRICVFPAPKICEGKSDYRAVVLEKNEVKVTPKCCEKCTDFPLSKQENCSPLAQVVVKRRYMGEGVKRIEIDEGGILGCLFVPSEKWGRKTFPAVIDMFGSVGGLVEHRSALLASKGILSLSLPFFNYKTLPKTTKKLDLIYFENAVRFLLSQPMVEKVGTIGVSQGGLYALAMASELPKGLLSGAISISPPSRFFDPLIYHGETILEPFSYTPRPDYIANLNGGKALLAKDMFADQLDVPPVDLVKSECPILFFSGVDDKNLPAPELVEHMISYAKKEREKKGIQKRDNFTHYALKGAGHLIEPPYSPHCYCSWHGTVGAVMLWGGDVDDHAAAQEFAWEKTISFIHDNLSKSRSKM